MQLSLVRSFVVRITLKTRTFQVFAIPAATAVVPAVVPAVDGAQWDAAHRAP